MMTYTLEQIEAAYLAGYAQGSCLSGTLEGDEEWQEYFSCVLSERPRIDGEDQGISFTQTAYDQGRADAIEQLSTQIAPHVHLIEVFCKDMTARNWADKADYINQQAGRIRDAIGGYNGPPAGDKEEDYRRAAEADFQSHVSFLKREREWE